MAKINLLPWRAERRKQREREFQTMLGGALIVGLLAVGVAIFHWDGLKEDQSTYIPLGTVHRLKNPGMIPLVIIEIQSGTYLGEDDIVRLEDSYGR